MNSSDNNTISSAGMWWHITPRSAARLASGACGGNGKGTQAGSAGPANGSTDTRHAAADRMDGIEDLRKRCERQRKAQCFGVFRLGNHVDAEPLVNAVRPSHRSEQAAAKRTVPITICPRPCLDRSGWAPGWKTSVRYGSQSGQLSMLDGASPVLVWVRLREGPVIRYQEPPEPIALALEDQ